MTIELIKAFLVGIIAALPVGPILLMVIQKTLCGGKAAGIMTGLGSAVADMIYAAVGLFALSAIQRFIQEHDSVITVLGGGLLLVIGIGIFFKKIDFGNKTQDGAVKLGSYAMQSFLSVLANPAALAVMLGLLSAFGFASSGQLPLPLIVLAVFAGELLYWVLIVLLVGGKLKLNEKVLTIVSKTAGAGIGVFALVLLVKGLIALL